MTDSTKMRVDRALPWIWALVLGSLLLGPALGRGYVLSYDMVWVPDLALRTDFLGVDSALPRAVPSDAVVSVLDELVPGMLLQKLVLLMGLVAAGAGAARLVGGAIGVRLVAVSVMVWNPFVVERLVLGHWPVLVGYAVLPWLVIAARRARSTGPGPALLLLVPLGCLSAGAGLVTSLVVLVIGWSARARDNLLLLALVLAANAPWLVSGLIHSSDATSDPGAAALFALRGEGHLPAVVTALGLGGVWNAEVVPTSREGVLGLVSTLVLVALCALGARRWWRAETSRDRVALLVLWTIGWGLAVLTWAAPGVIGWLAGHVPGGGLLRDGSRFLALCVPLLVILLAHGVTSLGARIRDHGVRTVAVVGLVLTPIALMPDAAWGVSGSLHATEYPRGYADAAAAIADDTRDGDVVVLPFSAYRAPSWNQRHKVLDPLPRHLPRNYVVNDQLLVEDRMIAGEDPRVPKVLDALDEPSPSARARALAALGIRYVVSDASGPEAPPEVSGTVLSASDPVTVIVLDEVAERATPGSWPWWMGLAWAAFLTPLAAGLVGALRTRRARHV
ncbi:hypothetical protein BJ980_000842 [Nocardioides daedukensis]|uniref:Glycosyltransferase RgtA/B/C/D-like domain-containing protein n=1 Tax=Nocardioides daedukensis TaxID=634462 RepID=A0A7Y9RZ06_9ACTN|nr:hypothetical protein [Nocardioides daedukensis]NYG57919.1 hypothetical protein [Nocardioides daedukensis]